MLTSECICTHLRRAARGVSRHYDEALSGFGVNVAQFSLLRHLQRLDRPSITTLAEAMGLERSTLGRNLRVLEAEGLVALADGDDQRNRVVLLTEAGTQLLRAAYPAWEQAQIKLVERLGEGPRDELVRLLDQLA
ncbi:TPA: MarR family winged helix-turn-helix transcriptional regulator [Pseudomonas putida]|jgi:DNA-binding MarR family transcriptional regulator|uniref:Transcriptional regulator, MarR family n=1 Tax=Pseudomonas putida (strain GB-1) TaxID=76869 RepID=B0KT70_PSEPG|nr:MULTISPECIES: MarR family winged helix-turn-helix transcriptional regulator [Pseudomonas]ABY97188.1 transcriptional regulator, MarR family [Pseudomonas putida GB-1]APE97694.1 MarR family transcriptional regulator [Pseudomonas putida]MBP0707640.1 winged helix-turn-helix transcriptional regulator [Pseudomonas sp. T34]MCE1001353.1 MarR family winged helix-turn-helix transcriptional regulator [Pseudomonas sp. NMI1173_11]MCK2187079.1 MarR family winged helix-turn-helix transcriptional regulator 